MNCVKNLGLAQHKSRHSKREKKVSEAHVHLDLDNIHSDGESTRLCARDKLHKEFISWEGFLLFKFFFFIR